jgi:hypothetical protein
MQKKALGKIQYSFMMKILIKLGKEGKTSAQ